MDDEDKKAFDEITDMMTTANKVIKPDIEPDIIMPLLRIKAKEIIRKDCDTKVRQ